MQYREPTVRVWSTDEPRIRLALGADPAATVRTLSPRAARDVAHALNRAANVVESKQPRFTGNSFRGDRFTPRARPGETPGTVRVAIGPYSVEITPEVALALSDALVDVVEIVAPIAPEEPQP